MSIWEIIKIVLSILPSIVQVVKQLEGIFPESGQGQMKLELVIKSLEQITGFSAELVPVIEKVVSAVVAVFNSFGVFKKG